MVDMYNGSVESDLMMPILKSAIKNTYTLCRSHIKYKNEGNNEYPCVRLGFDDVIEKYLDRDELVNVPEKLIQQLYDRLNNRFYDDIGCLYDEENCGVEIFSDLNGYRLLCNIPIVQIFDEIDNLENDFKIVTDESNKVEINKELEELYDKLIDCGKKFIIFQKCIEEIKKFYEGYILVYDNYGNIDFVYKDYYEDFKEDYGYKLFNKNLKKKIVWEE